MAAPTVDATVDDETTAFDPSMRNAFENANTGSVAATRRGRRRASGEPANATARKAVSDRRSVADGRR